MSVFDSVVPAPELSFSESPYTPSNHPDIHEQSAPSLSSPVCIRCGGLHPEGDCPPSSNWIARFDPSSSNKVAPLQVMDVKDS